MYSLDSVITVVDAKVILDRLAEEKPEGVENEAVEQVCFADKVLLNKTDLADEAKLKKIEGEIRKLNPTAPILRCLHSKVTPKELLNIRAFDLKRVLDFDPEFLDPDQVSHLPFRHLYFFHVLSHSTRCYILLSRRNTSTTLLFLQFRAVSRVT